MSAPALLAPAPSNAAPSNAAPSNPRCRTPVVVRPAPRREPPYDDEVTHLHLVGPNEQALPFQPEMGTGAYDPLAAPQADLMSFARRLMIGVVECLGARRSVGQLAAHLSRGAYTGLIRDVDSRSTLGRWGQPIGVRSVRVCQPADAVAEVSAVIVLANGQFRAAALRLEGGAGRWRCVWMQLA